MLLSKHILDANRINAKELKTYRVITKADDTQSFICFNEFFKIMCFNLHNVFKFLLTVTSRYKLTKSNDSNNNIELSTTHYITSDNVIVFQSLSTK